MNVIQNIANQIVNRVEAQAKDQLNRTGKRMGKKAKDQLNLEMWCGAVFGLVATEGPEGANTKWVNRVLTMVVWPRGYEETERIARDGRDADRLAEVEAEEADINRMFKIKENAND